MTTTQCATDCGTRKEFGSYEGVSRIVCAVCGHPALPGGNSSDYNRLQSEGYGEGRYPRDAYDTFDVEGAE